MLTQFDELQQRKRVRISLMDKTKDALGGSNIGQDHQEECILQAK